MSLINQVLNELEHRGANSPLADPEIRAVPPRPRSRRARYVVLALPLLAVLGAEKWYLSHAENPVPARSVAMVPPVSGVVAAPSMAASAVGAASAVAIAATGVSGVGGASGVAAAAPPPDSLHGRQLIAVNAEDQPEAAPEVKKKARRKSRQAPAQVAAPESRRDSQLKTISPQQHVDNEFSRANRAAQEGRLNDALAGYQGVLRLDPMHHASRRALVSVLVSLKRNGDAESALQDGLKLDPREASFAMLLARLQVERNAVPSALETLQTTLPYADSRADYQAFVAALLQRQDRHDEAVAHYQAALKLQPGNGIWLMGAGISFQALHRDQDARAAYQRALASNTLNAQLQAFVQQKLKEL